jgi:vacuolar-type H+-ATPase subunit E/Vma4
MEELQSTEALDKEILEDARKKAFKILKTTDESITTSKTNWQQKLQTALEDVRKTYAQKNQEYRLEVMARLPMDKQRIRLETIERFLNKAMTEFLESLDRPSMLRILEKNLLLGAKELSLSREKLVSGKGECRYHNLSKEECSKLLGVAFPGTTLTFTEDPLLGLQAGAAFTAGGAGGGALPAGNKFPALVLDFPQARLNVSAAQAAETALLDNRAELVTALMGALEDVTMSKEIRLFKKMIEPIEGKL